MSLDLCDLPYISFQILDGCFGRIADVYDVQAGGEDDKEDIESPASMNRSKDDCMYRQLLRIVLVMFQRFGSRGGSNSSLRDSSACFPTAKRAIAKRATELQS